MENLVPESELKGLIDESKKNNIEKLVVGIFIEQSIGNSPNDNPRKVLIVKRASDEVFLPNVEEIPGGGVDPGETIPETVIRETLEETGLRVTKIIKYVNQFDYLSRSGRLTRQFNFLVEVNDGKLVQNEDIKLNPKEHSSFKWIGKDDLGSLVRTEDINDSMRQCLLDYFHSQK